MTGLPPLHPVDRDYYMRQIDELTEEIEALRLKRAEVRRQMNEAIARSRTQTPPPAELWDDWPESLSHWSRNREVPIRGLSRQTYAVINDLAPCARCSARIGEPCRSTKGKPTPTHEARRFTAQRTAWVLDVIAGADGR